MKKQPLSRCQAPCLCQRLATFDSDAAGKVRRLAAGGGAVKGGQSDEPALVATAVQMVSWNRRREANKLIDEACEDQHPASSSVPVMRFPYPCGRSDVGFSAGETLTAASAHLRARRYFLAQCGLGMGHSALAWLLLRGSSAAEEDPGRRPANPLAPKPPHFAPKAKSVIHLFMAGAPSQLELFDNKPLLTKYDGQPIPQEVVKDQRYAFIQRSARILAPRYKFARHGQSGAELSEMLPHLAGAADDIAIVRSMHTDQFNHAPAQIFFSTGSSLPGRPSMGAWVTYGLGSQCDNLPAYVVLSSGGGASGGAANFASGFLPTVYAGVPFRRQGDPILNVANPPGIDQRLQRDSQI